MGTPLRRRLVHLGFLLAAGVSVHTALVAEEPDRLGRAVQLQDQGRHAEALQLLRQVVASEPDNHRALWNMGLLSMADRELDEAIRWFDEAIEVDSRIAEYHLWRGYAYAQKIETCGFLTKLFLAPKIRGSFEEAVRLAPRDVRARRALMQYYEHAPAVLGGSRTRARRQAAEIRGLESGTNEQSVSQKTQ